MIIFPERICDVMVLADLLKIIFPGNFLFLIRKSAFIFVAKCVFLFLIKMPSYLRCES